MMTQATAAVTRHDGVSLCRFFEAALCEALAPATPVIEGMTASLEGGDITICFSLLGLPNAIASRNVGEIAYRGSLDTTQEGSEAARLICVLPFDGVAASITARVGYDLQCGSRNGFLSGVAVLHETVAQARTKAAEAARKAAGTDLAENIRELMSILIQLPVWDACRLLTEAFEQVDDPEQRARLTELKASMGTTLPSGREAA